ncbi:WD40 repeat domain-containing protein [Humisphaera borealis]|uniref:WD40 repeat domain-containing protein n=1 Tax=Humisphaera borealis TaxID=2807512 RepID=A0A7M2X2Q6_9BACT|nr:hypothetical protein [Humisphaera borealis]QOV91712.1 hypothetical protein IPV69_10265 [Humisphaera borealis]
MPETTEQPDVVPVPRILPMPPVPKKGAKPDPSAAFVGPDGFALVRPRTLEHDREFVFARFSPCGKFIFAGGYDGRVYRWSIQDDADTIATFEGHGGWMQGLAFHRDRKRMFTGDSWGQLLAWDYAAANPKPLWKREDCHSQWMRSMTLSPDGHALATCGADRVVRLWSSADGKPIADLATVPDDLMSAHFHPDGSLLIGDLKGVIHQFDIAKKKAVRTLDASVLYSRPMSQGVKEINDVGGVRCMTNDPKGQWLIAGGTQPATSGFLTGKPTAVCFDFATGKAIHTWQWEKVDPSEGLILGLDWHPGGYVLAAASGQPAKGAVAGWKPGQEASVYLNKLLTHCRTVAVHPDGKRVAVTQVLLKPGGGSGNGRRLSKDGEYGGLVGRVMLFDTAAVGA